MTSVNVDYDDSCVLKGETENQLMQHNILLKKTMITSGSPSFSSVESRIPFFF